MIEKKICYHADIKLEQMWSVRFSSTHLLVFAYEKSDDDEICQIGT